MPRDLDAEKHPRPGDKWVKTSNMGKKLSRYVFKVDGKISPDYGFVGTIHYTNEHGKNKNCWCSSWRGWVRDAQLVERGPK